jgi:hypothetical protein
MRERERERERGRGKKNDTKAERIEKKGKIEEEKQERK